MFIQGLCLQQQSISSYPPQLNFASEIYLLSSEQGQLIQKSKKAVGLQCPAAFLVKDHFSQFSNL